MTPLGPSNLSWSDWTLAAASDAAAGDVFALFSDENRERNASSTTALLGELAVVAGFPIVYCLPPVAIKILA